MSEVMLKGVRLAFPDLYVAKQFEGTGPFSYGATFLIDPTAPEHKALQTAIVAVAKAKWNDKAEGILKGIKDNSQKVCYYNGEQKDYDGFAGHYALSAKRQQTAGPPSVVDQKRQKLDAASGKPYAGCYVNAKVEIWAQDNKWGKGVRCTLIAVQFVKDGEAFSSNAPANIDGFDDEEGGEDVSDLI